MSGSEQICAGLLSFVYICITVGDPIIKSEEFAFHSIRFNPAKCFSLSQAISWISKGGGVVDELVLEVISRFVDIDGIVDNHCLIVHFIKITIIIIKTYVSYSVHMTHFLNNIHRIRSLEYNII